MSVLLCVPTHGAICPETVDAAYRICSRHRPEASFRAYRAQPVDRCRTLCVRGFLATEHSHLMMLDSDIVPPVECLDLMLAENHPFVCGIAPIELGDGLCSSVARKLGPNTYGFYRDFPDTPFDVDASGLSCCLIAREVFERVPEPWFKFEVRPDGNQTGEDIWFCERAAEVGIRPLAHPGVLCGHRRRVDVSTVRTQMRAITEIGLQGRSTLC